MRPPVRSSRIADHRAPLRLSLAFATAAFVLPSSQAAGQDCAPDGAIRYLCGTANVEDLVAVPRTRFILAGHLATTREKPAGFFLIDADRATLTEVVPDFGGQAVAPYTQCPGPPDPLLFGSHGISLRDRGNQPYELYAINHGGRETVEVFDVELGGAGARIRWKGCLTVPDSVSANGITHLPGSAVAVTSFGIRGDPGSFARMMVGEPAGKVVEWHPGTGWTELPGTAFPGDNGIAAAVDGGTLFVASWGDATLRVVPRPGNRGAARSISLGDLHPDNVHLAADGSLLVAGQVAAPKTILDCARSREPICGLPYRVVKVDPRSFAVKVLFDAPGTPRFGGASAAAESGGTLWIGTFRGNRIARVPLN